MGFKSVCTRSAGLGFGVALVEGEAEVVDAMINRYSLFGKRALDVVVESNV
jgi:hypothetical protein